MKNYFKFMMIAAAAAVSFAACEKEPAAEPEEKPEEQAPVVELTKDLKFTLEATEVAADQAKISVSHNGTTNDTWYGFVTTDVAKADAALVTAEVEELKKAGKITGLKKQTSTSVTLRGLEAQTEYKYVVVGLTENGEVYGVINSIKFETTRDADKFEETDDWKISYTRGENGGQVAEIFTIECEKGNGFYFGTINKSALETQEMAIVDYLKYVITTEIPSLLQYYTWDQIYIAESYTLASPRMLSGDYIAYAIGFDAKGEPTGYYSTQEFTIEEEAAKADYTQWVGDWEIACPYEYVDETTGETVSDVAVYTVTLAHYDNNYVYAMVGWETNGDISNDIREYVGEYAVPVYYNDGKLSFQETTLDYLDANGVTYAFGFYGLGNIEYEGKMYQSTLVGYDGLEIASVAIDEGGKTATINGNKHSVDGMNIEYTGMFYCGYPVSGQGNLAYWNSPMTFPLTMTKVESTGDSSDADIQPTSLKVNTMRKIQKKNFTPMYVK